MLPAPAPEGAAADGKGHIYDNIEDKSEVAAINSRTLKVENTWSIAPGEGPSGIAMDARHRRIFSVTDKMMTIMDADTGKIIATPGFHQRMAAIGVDVVGTTPADYAKMLKDDYEKWGKVVEASGLKPQ